MKMKKFMMVAMSALLITTLGACRGGRGGRGSGTSGDDSQSSDSSSGLKPKPGSSSGASSAGKSDSGSSTVKSIEDVVADINAAFKDDLGQDLLSYDSTDEMYEGAIDYSQSGQSYTNTKAPQSTLQPVVEDMKTYMPSYLVSAGSDHYWTTSEDFWEDGSGDTVYEAIYATSDGGVAVSLIGYVYNSKLLGQIGVYEPSED